MQALKQFLVRKFKEQDLDEVCKIGGESFFSPWSRGTVVKFYIENCSSFFVAEDGSEVVGYAMAAIERRFRFFNLHTVLVGHLLNLAVKRSHRRRGIGSALVHAVLEYLKKEGVEEIFLEVNAKNLEARAFYSCFRFEEIKLVKDFYFDGDGVVAARGV